MLSFADWTAQQSAPKTGGQSFTDWQTRSDPLVLPEWSYSNDNLKLDKYGRLMASDVLTDYYGQLSNNYLPSLDTFAKENSGRMVAFDPNRFMTAEDFGLGDGGGINRGSLRNMDLSQASHDLTWQNNGDSGTLPTYYRKRDGAYYGVNQATDGEELFKLLSGEDGTQSYESAGKYHKETSEEAMARLLAKEGVSGGVNDFMGSEAISNLTKDNSGKWGVDYVKDPTLKKYLDDPSWVSKDEDGNVTSIRAELYPMLMREQLGQEYRDIARGGTEASDGIGGLVKSLILGTVTGGLGLAGASALGFGSAAAGAGLGATAAGMGYGGLAVAGALGGGLSSALTGGDVIKGALTGGLAGGFTKFASPYVGDTLSGMGVTGTTNKVLSGGLTSMAGSGLGSAVTGNKFNPLSSFASGATQGYMGSQAGKEMLGDIGITNPYMQRMVGSLASGTMGSLAAGKNPNMQGMLANTGMKTFQQWLNDQSRG